MKIVYIYTALTTVGGVDRILIQKANYLAEVYSHDVYIITDSQIGRPFFFPISNKITHIDLEIGFGKQYEHGFLIRSYYYFMLMYRYRKRLNNLLLKIKADIVISTLGRDLDFLTEIKDNSLKVGESHIARPFCRNFHLMEQKGGLYSLIAKIWKKKLADSVRKLDALVVLTKCDADSWKEIKKTEIIPNSYSFYSKYGSNCQQKRVISVGRLNEQKGYDRLIKAWSIVSSRHPDWEINIYGNGTEKEYLDSLIKKYKIEQTFKIHNPVQNIKEKYLENSIYVMSSRFEGFPLVLIEAMACGLPCISFDCPHGASEIIKNEENGILVENNNIPELAEAICDLIENSQKRISMGKNAHIHIQSYAPEKIMRQWDDLFNKLKEAKT